MIISPERVLRDPWHARLGRIGLMVVKRECDDGTTPGQQLLWRALKRRMPRKVVHLPVKPSREPLFVKRQMRGLDRLANADMVKAEFERVRLERLGRGIRQDRSLSDRDAIKVEWS